MVYRKTLKWNKIDLNKKISKVQTKDRESLKIDLFDTLKIENRKVVSAPEVGLPFDAIAFCESILHEKDNLVCLFNPKFSFSDEQEDFSQTCHTLPGFRASIKRYSKVFIDSESSEGVKKIQLNGKTAAEFQKSIDFIYGKNLLSKVSNLKRKMYLDKFKKKIIKESKLGRDKERESKIKSLKKRKINRIKRKAKKK